MWEKLVITKDEGEDGGVDEPRRNHLEIKGSLYPSEILRAWVLISRFELKSRNSLLKPKNDW